MATELRTKPMASDKHHRELDRENCLRVQGVAGFFRDEEALLRRGKSLVVGRSRSCHLSLQRTAAYLAEDQKAIRRSEGFRKISREHFKISLLHPHILEIENLSRNGTYLDGKKIDRVLLSDFRSRVYEITIGDGQRFVLEWLE